MLCSMSSLFLLLCINLNHPVAGLVTRTSSTTANDPSRDTFDARRADEASLESFPFNRLTSNPSEPHKGYPFHDLPSHENPSTPNLSSRALSTEHVNERIWLLYRMERGNSVLAKSARDVPASNIHEMSDPKHRFKEIAWLRMKREDWRHEAERIKEAGRKEEALRFQRAIDTWWASCNELNTALVQARKTHGGLGTSRKNSGGGKGMSRNSSVKSRRGL